MLFVNPLQIKIPANKNTEKHSHSNFAGIFAFFRVNFRVWSQKKGVRCCPQSLLFGAGCGTCSQVSTWLRRRASEDGRQPHCVGSKCKAFVAQSAKVPPTKKDPKVFLVLVVGLEPTRSPTRPLNVRVCHSATPASMDYVSIIFFCCQEILKKKFTFSCLKKNKLIPKNH